VLTLLKDFQKIISTNVSRYSTDSGMHEYSQKVSTVKVTTLSKG
jgi:hypothetical protein